MNDLILQILQTMASWDADLFLAINGHHCKFMDYFMVLYSGKWEWIPLYASFLYVMMKNYSWQLTLKLIIAIVVLITLTDQIASGLLKPLVCRLRPSNLDSPIASMVHIVNGYRGGRFGFPSSHASNAWGITFFVIYLFRKRPVTYFMVAWSFMMCYSRIYIGVHYPADLFVGTVIGFIVATLVYKLFMRYIATHDEEKFMPKHTNSSVYVGAITIVVFLLISVFEYFVSLGWI